VYTYEELKYLSDEELINILKKEWKIPQNEPIILRGELISKLTTHGKFLNALRNVTLVNGTRVEYPNNNEIDSPIYKQGVFIALSEHKLNLESQIVCEAILAPKSEREKHNNLFELNIIQSSIKKISQENIEFIETSIPYIKKTKKDIQILEKKKIDVEDEYKIKLNKLKTKEENKQKKVLQLENKRKNLSGEIDDKEESLNTLNSEIEEAKERLDNIEGIMGTKLEKLRSYIKEKADILLDLEFIDEAEYNNILMLNKKLQEEEHSIGFRDELLGDSQKAIAHIQAYLFAKDIVYPRQTIEDFFALIQTNDLIILAGESGSGKTNLVKSFADAMGGKSFIIPVKPNWTSSEDLLGYYNPLEKKYLATPFLEALLEAKENPHTPYFICLDEMNLARVEYYFADFLSLLEERGELPQIKLYSEDESAHILSEFKNVIETIKRLKEKHSDKNLVNFIDLLQDEEVNRELTRIFGFSDKDSLIKYHTDLRRMLSGILNTPATIQFPKNVRIIGAINIDETTHYLSPKILDRAHIMKFDSPLLYDWVEIAQEIEELENKDLKLKFDIEDLGTREAYPSYDIEDEFCQIITEMTQEYFSPLGVEVGLRTIRQGLNYQKIYQTQGSDSSMVLNNFFLSKILPKMTFDGNKKVKESTKIELLERLSVSLEEKQFDHHLDDAIEELKRLIETSKDNDNIVNYWA
jgi:MoxR-like ATPase